MLSIMMSMKEFPSVRYHSMNFHQLVSPLLNRDIAMCSQLSQILKNYSSSFFNVSLNTKMTRNALKHFYMKSYTFWTKLMELYGGFPSQWNLYGIWRNYMGFSLHNGIFMKFEGIVWVFLFTIPWLYMHLLTGFQYGIPNSGVTSPTLLSPPLLTIPGW